MKGFRIVKRLLIVANLCLSVHAAHAQQGQWYPRTELSNFPRVGAPSRYGCPSGGIYHYSSSAAGLPAFGACATVWPWYVTWAGFTAYETDPDYLIGLQQRQRCRIYGAANARNTDTTYGTGPLREPEVGATQLLCWTYSQSSPQQIDDQLCVSFTCACDYCPGGFVLVPS